MTNDFSDVLTCDLRSGMLNRKSTQREIRIYLLSFYACRKGLNEKKNKYYEIYKFTFHLPKRP